MRRKGSRRKGGKINTRRRRRRIFIYFRRGDAESGKGEQLEKEEKMNRKVREE